MISTNQFDVREILLRERVEGIVLLNVLQMSYIMHATVYEGHCILSIYNKYFNRALHNFHKSMLHGGKVISKTEKSPSATLDFGVQNLKQGCHFRKLFL